MPSPPGLQGPTSVSDGKACSPRPGGWTKAEGHPADWKVGVPKKEQGSWAEIVGMTRMGCEERGTRFSMDDEPWAALRGGRKGSKPISQKGEEWAMLVLTPALQSPASPQLLGDGSVGAVHASTHVLSNMAVFPQCFHAGHSAVAMY